MLRGLVAVATIFPRETAAVLVVGGVLVGAELTPLREGLTV
jgi:hypothetical protein